MRLSISNIAWDTAEDEIISTLLRRFNINAIDVAPGKYFPDPSKATDRGIAIVRNWWSERGVEIIGMQALLFGTAGLNMFGPLDIQAKMLHHLSEVCRVGAVLGAKLLVFGSPKNRDRSALSDQHALDAAVLFFRRFGYIAESYGVKICLEPNPSCYGANFMTTSAETALVVEQVSHPAVRMQFDSGALVLNGEDPNVVLGHSAKLIGHVHISEPGLLPLGSCEGRHSEMSKAIKEYLPHYPVTIEMLATKNEPHEVAIKRALQVAVRNYRMSDAEGLL